MKTFVIFLLSLTVMLFVQYIQQETSIEAISFSVASGIGFFGLLYDYVVKEI